MCCGYRMVVCMDVFVCVCERISIWLYGIVGTPGDRHVGIIRLVRCAKLQISSVEKIQYQSRSVGR